MSGTFPGSLPRLRWPCRAHLHHLTTSGKTRSRPARKEEVLQGLRWLEGGGRPLARHACPTEACTQGEEEAEAAPRESSDSQPHV